MHFDILKFSFDFHQRSLTNIQEIEINFLQPYIQNNKTLKSIQMSPTKQKPFTDVPINTLVIAEATVSPLGFEYRSEPRKLLLIKLSQLEVSLFCFYFFLRFLSLSLSLTLRFVIFSLLFLSCSYISL
jgi:hypothetical protein